MSTKSNTAKKTATKVLRKSASGHTLSNGPSVDFAAYEPSPTWKSTLEENLVKEGISRRKARSLVKMAAS